MANNVKKSKAARKVAVKAKPSKADLLAKQIEREIAKREAIFKKASLAEKRVLIAKDVIAQIKANRIKPEAGSFVMVEKVKGFISATEADTRYGAYNYAINKLSDVEGAAADVRKLYLENKIQQCSCCALGGMFMSCTLYNNNTTLEGLCYSGDDIGHALYKSDPASSIPNGLDKFFSVTQLRLIEQTFEGDNGVVNSGENDDDGGKFDKFSPKAEAFYNKYKKPKDRLIAIMQNIIDNNGTFKP